MNRRELLKSAGLAAAAAALPLEAIAGTTSPTINGSAEIVAEVTRLQLRHMWTTTMSSSAYRDTLQVRYTREGVTGVGEGAPIVRYKENAAEGKQVVDSQREFLSSADPWTFEKLNAELFQRVQGAWAAKAAIDVALLDWIGKKLNVPLYRMFGLDPADAPITTFSIGIDTPEVTRQKTLEAKEFPILKIKVGLQTDEATIAAVRSVTDKPLRVDANEGWTNREEAVRKINWLATQGVQFVEQPMPADRLDDIRWVRERVKLPLIGDESCQHASDIPKLVGVFDGVNVKLDKAGGIQEALRMIYVAKSLGLKTMLGCMVSTSVSVTAAAQISPLVDYADLDGNLLIANDPYVGVKVNQGKLILPSGPGLGLTRA